MRNLVAVHFACVLACSANATGRSISVDPSDDPGGVVLTNDEGEGDPGGSETGVDTSEGDFELRRETWIYVAIPYRGNFTLQEVLEVGTPGWAAFEDFGVPLDSFETVRLFTPVANSNNSGVVVLMLTPHCLGDFNSDGSVNVFDVPLFGAAYLAGDSSADLNHNGFIDIIDQLVFLTLVGRDCVPAW